ncbi:uncharacterized protein LOC105204613 [Solenopsis invicta]|uniref:uncharacterized protein LOC105204613 n=1 Tax=Solenopsis invicta TaxID=13686 RepID=UPI00193DEB4F|nr:uncharacterized protein LOC105204613 [Solenopsis invicta]
MPLQRIKYALAHLSRKEHIALLARPNWRRLRRTDPNVLARPFAVRRAAIRRGRASKRIRVMAQPKFVTKKYDPAAAPPPYPRIHPKTLAARSTKRIVDLALPKRRLLLETMKLAATKNMKATVSDLLLKVRRSRYQRYRVFCNARQEREARKKRKRMAKLRRAFTKPEDWQRHMRVLERLAAPKVAAKPKRRKPTKRRKKRPLDWERLYFLALPQIRHAPKAKDPLEMMSRALTYRITKRIESLAVRRKLPEMPLRIPGAVSPAATKAIGSIEHTHYERYHRDPSASISPLDARRNRRHRSPAEAATFSSSPILVYRLPAPILLPILLDVVSKLIRGVSQRTSSRRDST